MTTPTQTFYDRTLQHLVAQGRRALGGPRLVCQYRIDDLRCAVGVHIPDNLYRAEMEDLLVDDLVAQWPDLKAVIPNMSLAQDLQTLHDDPGFWEEGGLNAFGKARAEALALDYGLTPYSFDSTVR